MLLATSPKVDWSHPLKSEIEYILKIASLGEKTSLKSNEIKGSKLLKIERI